jgi:hypothetical protein
MTDIANEDWRQIAEQVCKETDSSKMTLLVDQLCAELDRQESGVRELRAASYAQPTPSVLGPARVQSFTSSAF